MKRMTATVLALACVLATPSWAALKPGDAAPAFTAQAALGGQDFVFSLADALKKGPVVLYFFPKAFTTGCTAEAHEFAEAAGQFNAMGATLIGMSADDIGIGHRRLLGPGGLSEARADERRGQGNGKADACQAESGATADREFSHGVPAFLFA